MIAPAFTPDPEGCSCAALRQAARHVTQLYDEALRPLALSLNQYSILAKLGNAGPLSQRALAGLLVMDRSTLGHLLRPLEARGLLGIAVCATDRRARMVILSPAGVELMIEARRLRARAEGTFEEGFGPGPAAALRASLRQVTLLDLTLP